MRVGLAVHGLLLAACCVSCATAPESGGGSLSEQAPLPYSVLVAGGGVVDAPPELAATATRAYGRTFAAFDGAVVVAAHEVATALRTARVFARADVDERLDEGLGRRLREVLDVLPPDDPQVRELLARARAGGHDYVLVVQRVVDGGIEEWGVNERWPLTAATWLLVGLGALVQDHTFESRASLEAALFDVEEGRLVYRAVGAGAVVELALFGRGNLWSFVQSIVVPPFLVASRQEDVVESVRVATVPRLVAALARELKGVTCRRAIAERARVAIEVEFDGPRAVVRTRAFEGLGSVALRVDGEVLTGAAAIEFARALLDAQREVEGQGVVAEAALALRSDADFLQVLVRTVTGVVASTTWEVPRR